MRYILAVFLSLIIMLLQDNPSNFVLKLVRSSHYSQNLSQDNECSILVISGEATTDGRPILWKNRDVTEPDQKFLYNRPYQYPEFTSYGYTGNFYTSDTSRCFMGVNDAGFAIINANCYNLSDVLKDGIDDGDLMRWALERCATVEQWEDFLRVTGIFGRRDCWIFGVLDSTGEARLYECDNFNHTVYDANNPESAPDGYIVRSVFALSGWPTYEGLKRYNRSKYLVEQWTEHYPLDVKFILQKLARDFSLTCDEYHNADDPYPLPYYGSQGNLPTGFVNTYETINRYKTRSCAVIRGVLPNEDPRLATIYAILGQPVLSVAVPLWAGSQYVPYCLRGDEQAPWYSLIVQRMEELYPLDVGNSDRYMNTHYLLDSLRTGVFSWSLPLETWAIDEAEGKLENWRQNGFDLLSIRQGQIEISQHIWDEFVNSGGEILDSPETDSELPSQLRVFNYPNPFNLKTTIYFQAPAETDIGSINVNIYTILGERVKELADVDLQGGVGKVIWDGLDNSGRPVAAGVYLYVVSAPHINIKGKMLLLK